MGTIDTVGDLQKAYDELKAAEALLEGIPDWMRELHGEYTERKAQIDGADDAQSDGQSPPQPAEPGLARTVRK